METFHSMAQCDDETSEIFVCVLFIKAKFWSLCIRLKCIQLPVFVNPIDLTGRTNATFYAGSTHCTRIHKVNRAAHKAIQVIFVAFTTSNLLIME